MRCEVLLGVFRASEGIRRGGPTLLLRRSRCRHAPWSASRTQGLEGPHRL
jgi:hypothetical protein